MGLRIGTLKHIYRAFKELLLKLYNLVATKRRNFRLHIISTTTVKVRTCKMAANLRSISVHKWCM